MIKKTIAVAGLLAGLLGGAAAVTAPAASAATTPYVFMHG